jgi:hypothetical protein
MRKAMIDKNTLMELLEMAVESADGTFSNPSRETLKELERANNAFHDAVDEAVLVWLKTPGNIDKVKLNHPKLKGDDTPAKVANSLVYETDLAYYFYMGAIGHGVRMTDGSLNPFFMDNDYVAELEAFLRQKIRSEVQKLESAIDNAAYESMEEESDRMASRKAASDSPKVVVPNAKEISRSDMIGDVEYTVVTRPQADGKILVAVVSVPSGKVFAHDFTDSKETTGQAIQRMLRDLNKRGWGGMADASRHRKASVSDKDIKALMAEADNAGDTAQVKLCQKALKGDAKARRECEQVIYDATSKNMRVWLSDRHASARRQR